MVPPEGECGNIGYITVHEGLVREGESQRRPGLHTETPGTITLRPDTKGKYTVVKSHVININDNNNNNKNDNDNDNGNDKDNKDNNKDNNNNDSHSNNNFLKLALPL